MIKLILGLYFSAMCYGNLVANKIPLLEIVRTRDLGTAVIGELRHRGQRIAYTLEPKYKNGTKLKKTFYVATKDSAQLGEGKAFRTFRFYKVKGHTGIMFHIGNFRKDTEGCVLLGMEVSASGHSLTRSKEAFDLFMKRFENESVLIIQVRNP